MKSWVDWWTGLACELGLLMWIYRDLRRLK